MLVLEEKIKELIETQKMHDDKLQNQEVALQQLLKRVENVEEMMKNREVEEPDNTYSPPPLPPPLDLPSIHTMPLPPSAATPQLGEAHINVTYSPSTIDTSQKSTTSQQPGVQCLPITPKQSTANLPPNVVDRSKLASPAQTLHRYPKLQTEGKASILAVKLSRELFFGETTMNNAR